MGVGGRWGDQPWPGVGMLTFSLGMVGALSSVPRCSMGCSACRKRRQLWARAGGEIPEEVAEVPGVEGVALGQGVVEASPQGWILGTSTGEAKRISR